MITKVLDIVAVLLPSACIISRSDLGAGIHGSWEYNILFEEVRK